MAGLVPAIYVLPCGTENVDARHKAGHDECVVSTFATHSFAIPPPNPREVFQNIAPSEIRGRRKCRGRAAPAVSCAICTKESAHEHTGSAEAPRHSLRNGFTAYN